MAVRPFATGYATLRPAGRVTTYAHTSMMGAPWDETSENGDGVPILVCIWYGLLPFPTAVFVVVRLKQELTPHCGELYSWFVVFKSMTLWNCIIACILSQVLEWFYRYNRRSAFCYVLIALFFCYRLFRFMQSYRRLRRREL